MVAEDHILGSIYVILRSFRQNVLGINRYNAWINERSMPFWFGISENHNLVSYLGKNTGQSPINVWYLWKINVK